MILYVFQSFLWYYKYRYGTFYSQNYRVIPSVSICYIDVIHLHQSWQKKKKNQILRICYSTVTWIYIEMKNQGNTTRANFQSSNSSTFYHHPHTSQFLPFSLADSVSADSALGLTCSSRAAWDHTKPPTAVHALNPQGSSDTTQSITEPSPRNRWPQHGKERLSALKMF